jgi:hypothetical protein
MVLEFVLKFLGWAFVLVPTIIFFGVSFMMIKGAGEDDTMIKTLTLIGLSVFLIGAVTLALVYTTKLL